MYVLSSLVALSYIEEHTKVNMFIKEVFNGEVIKITVYWKQASCSHFCPGSKSLWSSPALPPPPSSLFYCGGSSCRSNGYGHLRTPSLPAASEWTFLETLFLRVEDNFWPPISEGYFELVPTKDSIVC
jgi:hypothetical protein